MDGRAIVVMADIVGPFGVRGWIKVRPHTAERQALGAYATWWIERDRNGEWTPMPLREAREHGAALVAQLEGVDTREAAATLAGARIGVPRSALPATRDDEIYQADLVGLAVVNRAGARLGRVVAVDAFGGHPLLRVAAEAAAGEAAASERLIPFVPAYIDGVDLAGQRIDVDWEADY